jgi:hypothetical protein
MYFYVRTMLVYAKKVISYNFLCQFLIAQDPILDLISLSPQHFSTESGYQEPGMNTYTKYASNASYFTVQEWLNVRSLKYKNMGKLNTFCSTSSGTFPKSSLQINSETVLAFGHAYLSHRFTHIYSCFDTRPCLYVRTVHVFVKKVSGTKMSISWSTGSRSHTKKKFGSATLFYRIGISGSEP